MVVLAFVVNVGSGEQHLKFCSAGGLTGIDGGAEVEQGLCCVAAVKVYVAYSSVHLLKVLAVLKVARHSGELFEGLVIALQYCAAHAGVELHVNGVESLDDTRVAVNG